MSKTFVLIAVILLAGCIAGLGVTFIYFGIVSNQLLFNIVGVMAGLVICIFAILFVLNMLDEL